MKKGTRGNSNMRGKILAAATDLFAEKGYEGVAIRAIANEVGITLPTIYHYFKGKRGLYEEVEASTYGAAREKLDQILHIEGSPEQRFRDFLQELIKIFETDVKFYKLVQRNLLESDPENRKFLVNRSLQGIFTQLKALMLEWGLEADPDMAPVAVLSLIMGFIGIKGGTKYLEDYAYSRNKKKENEALVEFIASNLSALPR